MKITRKEIRRIILEQVQPPPKGPFLIIVVDKTYGEVAETFIAKELPEENWWHAEDDGGYADEYVINIVDMSKKVPVNDDRFPGGRIVFDGNIVEIKSPD